jgi:hypothetical protein
VRAVRTAALALCLAAAAAGCGGGRSGPNAQDVLKQTAANLGAIHSGTLGLKLLVTPSGQGTPFGFELHGPFQFGAKALPVTRMAYTQIANGTQATAVLVSDGTAAYVETAGKKIMLSPSQTALLRKAASQLKGTGSTGQLVVGNWLRSPKGSDGGNVAGAATDKVTAELDLPQVVGSLAALAQLSGRQVTQLSKAEAKRLADAVRSSSFELYSGKKDRLLRRLRLGVDLGFGVPSDMKAALGDLVGAKIDFQVDVANPKR